MPSIPTRPEAADPVDASCGLVLARATQAAHRLHDSAGQSLVSAHRFVMASRSSAGAGDSGAALASLDEATTAIASAMRDLRAVMDRLAPPELEAGGLRAALGHYGARRLAKELAFVVDGDLPRAGGVREWLLLGIALDGVDWVAERPGTSAVRVSLADREGTAVIAVSGDATEAHPSGPEPDRSALAEAGRQAAGLGGRLDIVGESDGTWEVRIEVPLGVDRAPGPGRTAGEIAR